MNLTGVRALDLAFYFTVLEIFDFKFSVRLETVEQLFRQDFKVFIVNAKLRHINGGCPDLCLP